MESQLYWVGIRPSPGGGLKSLRLRLGKGKAVSQREAAPGPEDWLSGISSMSIRILLRLLKLG